MISQDFINKLEKINELSLKLNETKGKTDDYTLKSMIDHANEINDLFKQNNPHWVIETGDLMIHCMRILISNGYDLNEMFDKCQKRFVDKISEKLKD